MKKVMVMVSKLKMNPEHLEQVLTDLIFRGWLDNRQVSDLRRFWNLPEVKE